MVIADLTLPNTIQTFLTTFYTSICVESYDYTKNKGLIRQKSVMIQLMFSTV